MSLRELLAEIDATDQKGSSPRSLDPESEPARTIERLTERLGLSAAEAELLTRYALEGYELLDPHEPAPDPSRPKFINSWDGRDDEAGERPVWLDDAVELYRCGSSARAVAESISDVEHIQVSKDQIRALLKRAGVQLRSSGAEPLGVVFARNLAMADPARLEGRLRSEARRMASETTSEADLTRRLRDRFFVLSPRFVKLYGRDPLWSDPRFTDGMGHRLSAINAMLLRPVAGQLTEGMITSSLRGAGYRAVESPSAKAPGSDPQMEALLDGKQVLLHTSHEPLSVERRNEVGEVGAGSAGVVRLAALFEHGSGTPDSVATLREVITAAIERGEEYEQVSFLQAVTERPPVAEFNDVMRRYSLIDVSKRELRDRLLAVAADDARLAAVVADARAYGRETVGVPVEGESGDQLFTVYITERHVAITAISPTFVRRSCSWWVPRDPGA